LGLHFTDQAPTNAAFIVGLQAFDIDLAPGEANGVVERRFVLPVPVAVLSVLPHAHYLGRDLQGFARLPDGSVRWLLRLPDWDFNWQGDYTLATPLALPAGAELVMRYAYDNSTNNVRNPFDPPRRVRYGVETTDEMAELWLQVLPRSQADRARLERAYQPVVWESIAAFNRYRL
jgi:hypothetical protein